VSLEIELAAQAISIPDYLRETYWWAYVHPVTVQLFERQWLVNLILWGNFARLRDAALEALGAADASYDRVLIFFLLHEQPAASRLSISSPAVVASQRKHRDRRAERTEQPRSPVSLCPIVGLEAAAPVPGARLPSRTAPTAGGAPVGPRGFVGQRTW